jgi:predicted RNA methylase
MKPLEKLSRDLEHFESPAWAVLAILEKEILTKQVYDPCCGTGILGEIAIAQGYEMVSFDIHDWGYKNQLMRQDYLDPDFTGQKFDEHSVIMNPPFSKASEFVLKAKELGARKILCFQRFSWLESKDRREFWDKNPPAKIYLCAERASCWRHDIPPENRKSSTPTSHAWFVWEKGFLGNPTVYRLYKST